MEKISSILPGNPRVHSVDLEDAPPARPGAPTFGRKAGRNTVNDRITLSAKAKEMAAQETMMNKNPKEASRAKMVEELNRKFFETRLQKPEKEVPQTQQISDRVIEAVDQNFGDLKETISQYEMPEETKATRLSVEA